MGCDALIWGFWEYLAARQSRVALSSCLYDSCGHCDSTVMNAQLIAPVALPASTASALV